MQQQKAFCVHCPCSCPCPPCAGAATKLESQFRLTFSMILNLLRVEDLKVLPGTAWGTAW